MKFLVSLLLTAFLAFVLGLYFPWWSVALASFAVAALIHQPAGKAFLSGSLGIFVLWAILSWIIDSANHSVLSARIALVLPLGGSVFLLILVTAFVGSLVGGLGALSGSYLRRITHSAE